MQNVRQATPRAPTTLTAQRANQENTRTRQVSGFPCASAAQTVRAHALHPAAVPSRSAPDVTVECETRAGPGACSDCPANSYSDMNYALVFPGAAAGYGEVPEASAQKKSLTPWRLLESLARALQSHARKLTDTQLPMMFQPETLAYSSFTACAWTKKVGYLCVS
jgi:hypothetical protein